MAGAAPQEMQMLLRAVLRSPHGNFKLSQAFKSSPNAPFNDRFKLAVTLGSGSYDWTLVLNAADPATPPDFIANEDSEAFVEYNELNGIKNWDPFHAPSLLKLLNEFRDNLRKYHADRAKSFSQELVVFEIESILGLCPEAEIRVADRESMNVECIVPIFVKGHEPADPSKSADQSSEGGAAALARSGSHLAAAGAGEGQVADCKLCIVMDQDMKNVKTSLIYPDSVAESLRVVCPGWETNQTHAFDFIPLVSERVRSDDCNELQNLIVQVALFLQVKRKLKVESLKEEFLKSMCTRLVPMHMDKETFTKASFLCSLQDRFDAVVHVHTPSSFPEEKPSLVFQSVAELLDRQPITDYVLEYPYNPQWTIPEIVDQIAKVISSQLPEFRNKVQSVTSAS